MDIYDGNFEWLSRQYIPLWRHVADTSERSTVFQTWEWLSAWSQHQSGRRRFWVLAFVDHGVPVGFAALTLPPMGSPLRSVRWAGAGVSDYGDLIALPHYEAAVCATFGSFLREHRRRFDTAHLDQIRPGAVAEHLIGQTGVQSWKGETCPYLALPGDWEAFRKGLGKKLRQNVGYYARALEKDYTVEYRVATPQTFHTDMNAFFTLHQKRWRKRYMPGAFASERARSFHEAAAKNLLDTGKLRLHSLSLNGVVQGALYCFQHGKRCTYYLGGFEPELARLSLGTVLTAHAIRHSIEQDGATEFDFLRGDEPYKYKWGAVDRFNRTVSFARPGLVRPRLLRSVARTAWNVEQNLKHRMHQAHGGKNDKVKPSSQ